MFNKEKWLKMGDEYLENDKIATELLDYIKNRSFIDFEDLETFYVIRWDNLTTDQLQEIEHDGLEKFFLDALIGYGFIEKIDDGWEYVENRSKRVEEIINEH